MEPDIVVEPDRPPQGTDGRPALADLARADAGELARWLELALPGAGARPVASFNSGI
ncbi:hypothetical protein ABTX81_03795 [Kitasatospora sp. NPDC097605]|uniref:hypothetical protein n=1 Tax=Kitasatospora sp. NPDC097605 TaxID=3157226 RepID=UPI00331CA7C8